MGLKLWTWLALRPALFGLATRLGVRWLRGRAGKDAMIHAVPFGAGWTDGRDLPAPAGRTFRELYAARRANGAPAEGTRG